MRDLSDAGRTLADLHPSELLAYSSRFDKSALATLSAHASAAARTSHGGSSRASVERQIARAWRELERGRRLFRRFAEKVEKADGLAR